MEPSGHDAGSVRCTEFTRGAFANVGANVLLSSRRKGYDQRAVVTSPLGRRRASARPRGCAAQPIRATMDTTLDLLARAKDGDSLATNELFQRCLPRLRRWARGRLPQHA